MHHIIVTELIKSEAIRMETNSAAPCVEIPFSALWQKVRGMVESPQNSTGRAVQRKHTGSRHHACICETAR